MGCSFEKFFFYFAQSCNNVLLLLQQSNRKEIEIMSYAIGALTANDLESMIKAYEEILSTGLVATHHPNQQEGEVFLTNAYVDGYSRIGWASKRKGRIAYAKDGTMMDDSGFFFPVFVQRSEVEEGIEDLSRRLSRHSS